MKAILIGCGIVLALVVTACAKATPTPTPTPTATPTATPTLAPIPTPTPHATPTTVPVEIGRAFNLAIERAQFCGMKGEPTWWDAQYMSIGEWRYKIGAFSGPGGYENEFIWTVRAVFCILTKSSSWN